MSRNFYNSLEIWYFLLPLTLASHMEWWNSGIVECWNTGYDKRKKIISTKNVVSTCYNDVRQTSIFCFRPRKYAAITRKSIQFYSFWFSKPTIPIYQNPLFHHSIVPSLQLRSEAELSSSWDRYNSADGAFKPLTITVLSALGINTLKLMQLQT